MIRPFCIGCFNDATTWGDVSDARRRFTLPLLLRCILSSSDDDDDDDSDDVGDALNAPVSGNRLDLDRLGRLILPGTATGVDGALLPTVGVLGVGETGCLVGEGVSDSWAA